MLGLLHADFVKIVLEIRVCNCGHMVILEGTLKSKCLIEFILLRVGL